MNGVPLLPNLIQLLYKNALKPFLFRIDPETAHDWVVSGMKQLSRHPSALRAVNGLLTVEDPRLTVSIRSLTCPNPVGLGAGFDKSAELADVLPYFGFGFVEVGTLTPNPQQGQKKPRLFRIPSQEALINRMGFNNAGVKDATERLLRRKPHAMRIGINIGKGRDTPVEEAAEDYELAFNYVFPAADFIVVNVSSPNTPNLRDLQAVKPLDQILRILTRRNRAMSEEAGEPPKSLFVKVSPDNHEETLEEIARLAVEYGIGLVATNTTVDRSMLTGKAPAEAGGLSGKPLKKKSNHVIRRLRQLTKGVVPIIGVGGVFSAEDAYEKIRLGASLVQVYTGWIYEGPRLIPHINRGLLALLERDGFARIQDAVGTL